MTSYFEDFKKSMKKRLRILVSLVEKHFDDVCFLVDIDFTYLKTAIPRVRWPRPLDYEINVDEACTTITTLIMEKINNKAKTFGNYDVDKSKITMDLKITSVIRKKNKMVKKIKEKFDGGAEEEEDDDEEGDDVPVQAPLAITQGQGEDQEEEIEIEEGAKGEEANEACTTTKTKRRKFNTQAVSKKKKVAKPTQPKAYSSYY